MIYTDVIYTVWYSKMIIWKNSLPEVIRKMIKHLKNLFCFWTGCTWCCLHPCPLVFLCLYTVKTEPSIVLCYPYKQLNEISPTPHRKWLHYVSRIKSWACASVPNGRWRTSSALNTESTSVSTAWSTATRRFVFFSFSSSVFSSYVEQNSDTKLMIFLLIGVLKKDSI